MIFKEFKIDVYFNKRSLWKAGIELLSADDVQGSLLNRKILYFQNIIANARPAPIIETTH